MSLAFKLALAACAALAQEQAPEFVFGTTVVSTTGMRGSIHALKKGTKRLPRLDKIKPIGTIYTTSLRIAPRTFTRGFPGVTDRFEWFGISYEGKIWIEREGRYHFRVLSDDGAKLSVDGELVVDNDGIHPPEQTEGSATLTRGTHRVRVDYFPGPGIGICLVVEARGPEDAEWRVFDTENFRPPQDEAQWVEGRTKDVKKGVLRN